MQYDTVLYKRHVSDCNAKIMRENGRSDHSLLVVNMWRIHMLICLQEVCNMVAKATNEGRASPVVLKSPSKDVYEPWEMTEKERELTLKCVRLIQGRIPSKVGP